MVLTVDCLLPCCWLSAGTITPLSTELCAVALTREEVKLADALLARVEQLAAAASEKGVRLMIDAEHTYFQPVSTDMRTHPSAGSPHLHTLVASLVPAVVLWGQSAYVLLLLRGKIKLTTSHMLCCCQPCAGRPQAIDHTTQVLSLKHNRRAPVIFNTYQAYLKDSHTRLLEDMERARREGYTFAAKLVGVALGPAHACTGWQAAWCSVWGFARESESRIKNKYQDSPMPLKACCTC